jgi:hypothetical protein
MLSLLRKLRFPVATYAVTGEVGLVRTFPVRRRPEGALDHQEPAKR